jgi:PAS domain S-box-containing protein
MLSTNAISSSPLHRVWIVDDARLDASRAEKCLSPIADCEVFSHGAGMLERIEAEGPPDVLLLDWQLPELSGLELCRFLRKSYDQGALPIIMLTVMSEKAEIALGLSAGANDYLSKPFDDLELRARVLAAARTKQLFDRARQAEQALEAERDRLAESEAKFRRLGESGIIGIIQIDLNGTVLDANEAFLTMVGRSRAELCAGGIRVRDLTPPEYLDSDDRALQELLESGVCSRYQKELIRSDGTHVAVLQGAALQQRKPPRAVAYLLDVTEQRNLEADRRRLFDAERAARAEAELASRMKDEFLATVSHELRTPLNAILGWSQIARTHAQSKLNGMLETIERNARVQAKLIEDVLDISRIVSGKLRLDFVPTDFAQVVADTVDAMRPTAAAKGVELGYRPCAGGAALSGDAQRLQQVVWNLISNAIKFTPSGGSVLVALTRDMESVHLSVRDTGTGIASEFLPHVFERFRQADATSTRAHGGLGLGLSIVKHVVELHGGRVAAQSPGLGAGATFEVELPVAPREAALESVARDPSGPGAPQDSLLGIRVLLVDDEADSRVMLASLLSSHGAFVKQAESAEEALRHFDAGPFDIVVSDIAMPRQDGYDFMARIRSLPNAQGGRVPAIALTAYAREEDVHRASLAGFQLHVAKPVESTHIIEVVGRLGRNAASL